MNFENFGKNGQINFEEAEKSIIFEQIVHVEVKSSTYKTHVSMDEFCKKFSSRIANDRYLVYTKDYFKEGAMNYLPAYLAYFL